MAKSKTKNQYVDLGLVTLVSVLIVITIFIVKKCKLTCGDTREGYARASYGNDTSGTAYGHVSPVDFAALSNVDIGLKDDPHYKADPGSWKLPLNEAPVDMQRELRRQTINFQTDPDSPFAPIYGMFSDEFCGERARLKNGKLNICNPWVNNTTPTRDDLVVNGDLMAWNSLDRQFQKGNIMQKGMDLTQRYNVRKFNILGENASEHSPNAQAVPGLAPYNREMKRAVQYNLDTML